VDLDHVDVLGDTLTQVAHHKAGIIKPGGRVVTAAAHGDALAVIAREAEQMNAELRQVSYRVGHDGRLSVKTPNRSYDGIQVPVPGTFQQVNAATAITAVDWLAHDFGFEFPREIIESALSQIRFPGRFEVLQEQPTVILDGAHNPHKMRALVESFQSAFPGRKARVVMGMIAGKSIEATVAPLLAIANDFVFADFHVLGKPSASSKTLQCALAGLSPQTRSNGDVTVGTALDRSLAAARGDDIVLITGSLYFAGLAREHWHPQESALRQLENRARGLL